jgi:mono/diheme cytochrome c family protein
MRALKTVFIVIAVLLFAGAGFLAYALHSKIQPLAERPSNFDPQLVARGAQLAAVGNCNVCHTAQGGKAFAGGLPIKTPFGTIFSTNITPDSETGIGRWPESAFQRAMRKGVDIEGRHLYPAFPYDHFTLVSDEDNKALYAYLMTREPVANTPPANTLTFPYNVRIAVAGWKLLFFREGPYQPDPNHNALWNRGAYLGEGLAHCGACHTPRNALGAERKSEAYAGAPIEGWWAYAINKDSPAPVSWTQDALNDFLRRGWHEAHGMARGPMSPVVSNLSAAAPDDVKALASYYASVAGEPSAEKRQKGEALIAATRHPGVGGTAPSADTQAAATSVTGNDQGAKIYAATCASCHESGRPLPYGGLSLTLSTAPQGPTPENLINVTLYGLSAAPGERSAIMPGFRGSLNDGQVAALLTYIRARFTDKPAWTDLEQQVKAARAGDKKPVLYHSPGALAAPADASQRGVAW